MILPLSEHPLRVLIVDDDEEDVMLTRALFRDIDDFSAEVVSAGSYDEGIAAWRDQVFDLCLVDYRIGSNSGVDWIREIRMLGRTAPVIVVTGQGSQQVALEALAAGADDYLIKGRIDAPQLARSVRYALDRASYHAQLSESEERYRTMFERSPLPMWLFDVSTLRFLAVNEAAIEHYGYSREEFLSMTPRDIRPPEDVALFNTHHQRLRVGQRHTGHYRHRKKDGSIIEVDIVAHDVDFHGRQCRLVLVQDITSRLHIEASNMLLARAFESSRSGLLIADALAPDMPIIYVNPAFVRSSGYGADELLGRNCRFLQGSDRPQPATEQIRAAIERHDECEVVLRNYRKDGSLFWNQLALAPVRSVDGAVTHYIGVSTDLTDIRRYEAELTYLSKYDALSGLPRFVDAEEAFEHLLVEAAREGMHAAFYYVDIDRFHSVNETIGRRVGDETLQLFAMRIKQTVGDNAHYWRVAGDEFAILLRYKPGDVVPMAVAEAIRAALEMPIHVSTYRLFLSATVGVARFPENATTAADLFNCADAAMSRAKRHGRNTVMAFSNEQAVDLRERLALGSRLRDAIRDNELVLHYQPQVSSQGGRIVGMEALVRWQTSDMGLLPPVKFIGVAEELGIIVDLGRWVLHQACHQARRWLDAGHSDIRLAINVSALQLHRLSFVDEVREALDDSRLPATMLELELTESALMDDLPRAMSIMTGLKELGVCLALDDFGVGYSSLSHLKRLPLDKLKIDQSFVHDVAHRSGEAAIARAIIAMGHELHIRVVAEGVETEAQLGFLLRNFCDEFQGNLFSAALPTDQATAVLRRRYLEPQTFAGSRPSKGLLLLDDEENVLRALTRVLHRDGYKIHATTSATDAFEILATNEIQVIVSDERMPGMSGTEFLSKVLQMYPDTVRMVLSGYSDITTVTDAINRGAIYKFITKPWDDEKLRNEIREAFRIQARTKAQHDGGLAGTGT